MQGRGGDPFATAQIEAMPGGQRMEDDAADHERAVTVDLPGVGLRLGAVHDRDRAPADDFHDVDRAGDAGGVPVDPEAKQARVRGDESEQPSEPVPLLEMLVDDDPW